MKIIISIVIFCNIFLYAFKIEPETQIVSNSVFRGKTQSMGMASIDTKVILRYKGLHVGAWASRVSLDENSTNYMNAKLLKADSQVDLFAGYEMNLGRNILGVGYIDRRYLIDNHLESNISSEYYVYLNLNIGVDSTVKGFYNVKNILDPFLLEFNIKDDRGNIKSYATYGRYLNSSNVYWKAQVDSPLKYLFLRGYVSFGLHRDIPVVGAQNTIYTIAYKF